MDTRKAKGAGERGAGVQSSAPVVTVLPKAGRVWFTGDTHTEEGVGAEQGEQHPQTPPRAAGLGQHMHRPPAQGPAKQEHLPWTHITQGEPGNEKELTDTQEAPLM